MQKIEVTNDNIFFLNCCFPIINFQIVMGVRRNFSRGGQKNYFCLQKALENSRGGQKNFQNLFVGKIVKISTKFQKLVPKKAKIFSDFLNML